MRPIAGSFFVAQLSEGVALRKILSADAMVVLLNGVMPQAMPLCCAQQITPLLNSVDQVMAWLALQEARSQRRPVLIQLDSGMSRLGVTPEQLARLAAIFRQRGWLRQTISSAIWRTPTGRIMR